MRRLIAATLVALGCTPPSGDPAYPDLTGDIAACVALSAEDDRLACYENIARDLGMLAALPPEPPPPSRGNWIVNEDQNPLDDSRTVSVVLFATSGTGTYGDPVSLILRCLSGEIEAFVNWHSFLADDPRVTSRVGAGQARTATWSVSTDSEATFVPGNDVAFIRELMTAEQFVTQVTPYNESPVTAVFDLAGISAALTPLQEACPAAWARP